MNQSCFQLPSWYQATTLTERIASLQINPSDRPDIKINPEQQTQRMQCWKSQSPFTNDIYFAQRLALDGLSESELGYLLSEPIEIVQNRFANHPDWLTQIAEAFALPESSSIPLEIDGFLAAIAPLINQGRDRLHQQIQTLSQTYPHLPFDTKTIEALLFADLSEQLRSLMSRTMVLELNVARLQGVLSGDTPQERFESFLQRLRQPEIVLSLLQEYPVLARQLVISINRWVTFSLEFLQHLCSDWEAIRHTFSPNSDPGLLIEVDGSVGDTHRGGRAVLIAKFSTGLQLVYKPKSLAVDVHFQQLLTWLNKRGNHPPFRTFKVLNRETYGWVEFITAQGCPDSGAIARFYERQGAYLALLYALEATDFHSENLIAAGEYPVLVDLESLFHPRTEGMDATEADLPTTNIMAYSVLRVGLLPQRLWASAESEGVDLSGLGGKAGQLTPYHALALEEIGTDQMRFARKQMPMLGSQNLPTLNGADVNVLEYTDAIATGFTKIYHLLLQYREELLSDGPLAAFAEDEVRLILRPTQTYGSLLSESLHPNFLRNALERDRFFDRLWLEIEQRPYLAKAIAAERDDLWQGDIPLFTTRPNSHAIWSSANQQIADFFEETGMSLVQRRLQQLSEADLERQLWFIRASLTTLAMGEEQAQWPHYPLREVLHRVSSEQLLVAAKAVGDRLDSLALRDEKDVSWLGLTLMDQKHWTLASLGDDLYDGLPGVILFLAYLGHVTAQERYTALAKAALMTMQRLVESSKALIASIGGFNGWGGIIYTLTHLGVLWDEPELLSQAESLVNLLPDLIAKDKQLDIIGGAAGCIGSLLSLYRCKPSQHTLAVAIACGNHLISVAQPREQGIGWSTEGNGKPLAGFSHGCAGIAWALLELAALTGKEQFRSTALAAIAYERSVFSLEAGNWPDLREFENTVLSTSSKPPVSFMTAWCHGAPGICLARLRSLPYLNDAESQAEIEIALKTTLNQGFGLNHSLCHGDLGNLELLLQASQIFDDPKWRFQSDRLTAIILESIDQYGWLCGVPLGVETPGLMTGLAGIGYGLLRLAEPKRIPSVLTLAPPV